MHFIHVILFNSKQTDGPPVNAAEVRVLYQLVRHLRGQSMPLRETSDGGEFHSKTDGFRCLLMKSLVPLPWINPLDLSFPRLCSIFAAMRSSYLSCAMMD